MADPDWMNEDDSADQDASGSKETSSVLRIYSADELRALGRAELVSHTVRLQQLYSQLESDSRFLTWEFDELKESFRYYSKAAELAHRLNSSDAETIASLAIDEIPEYFNCEFAALLFYDFDAHLLRVHRATVLPSDVTPLRQELDGDNFMFSLIFSQPSPFIIDYDPEQKCITADHGDFSVKVPSEWPEKVGRQALMMPLWVKKNDSNEPLILGGLLLGQPKRKLLSKDVEAAVMFADLLSSSLYNARLVKKLNDMAIIDPLTMMYNRRHLISQLNMAMAQAKRHGHKLSIAMLDIDEFKRVNDTYGHQFGDEVLVGMGEVLKSSVRCDVDIPARYGGEEFIILMPFVGLESAWQVAERLREKIKGLTFLFDGVELSISCSFGLAEYHPGESLEAFIDRADEALYLAKRAGRDCVRATR